MKALDVFFAATNLQLWGLHQVQLGFNGTGQENPFQLMHYVGVSKK